VATQGHVLRPADFTATLAVETAVHYLDLTVDLPSSPPPDPVSLTLVRRVLEGLLGSPLPASWGDASAAVKGTGRVSLTDEDRAVLGALADRAAVHLTPRPGPSRAPGDGALADRVPAVHLTPVPKPAPGGSGIEAGRGPGSPVRPFAGLVCGSSTGVI
jgi:hypothetical protein